MIEISVPPGIGDIYWILMRLAFTGEKFHIRVPEGNMPVHQRAKFLEHLKCVEKVTYDGISFKSLKEVFPKSNYSKLEEKMYLEANTFLESGRRLEMFLPFLKGRMDYKLEWDIGKKSENLAEKALKKGKKNIVIYTSGVKNNKNKSTGRWQDYRWKALIPEIVKMKDVNVIWIGTSYDEDILINIPEKEKMTVWVDKPADAVIHLLRNCDKFLSYQSGLSCISVAEGIPTYMLYFEKLKQLRFTFCPPKSVNNSNIYTAAFFNTVKDSDILNWIKNS